jgi:Helicase conserved C-terminal domain
MPRASVFRWFGAGEGGIGLAAVRHLVVTDVAAEGLDLQRAARVVHYDLPWTPMRLEQREGRALRLGSPHREVEVIVFRPPAAIERALHITRSLAVKARLPAMAGLVASGRGLWRWRSELADTYLTGDGTLGSAVVPSGPPGILAGFELHAVGRSGLRLADMLVWIEPNGAWTEEESVVAARLAEAAAAPPAPPDVHRLREALPLLAAPIRARLALARAGRWIAPGGAPAVQRVALRLHQAIREAARRRDVETLAGLERALAFVGRGHTAGEAMELERLAEMGDGELERKTLRLPDVGHRWDAIEVRLGGILLFRPG